MMCIILSGIANLTLKGSDYHCIISFISKNEVINLMQNTDLTKNSMKLYKHKQFILIYKNW